MIELILKGGVVGLSFLLARLAYNLLQKEQAQEQTRKQILVAIYVFMIFSVAICLIGCYYDFTLNDDNASLEAKTRELEQCANNKNDLIQQKQLFRNEITQLKRQDSVQLCAVVKIYYKTKDSKSRAEKIGSFLQSQGVCVEIRDEAKSSIKNDYLNAFTFCSKVPDPNHRRVGELILSKLKQEYPEMQPFRLKESSNSKCYHSRFNLYLM